MILLPSLICQDFNLMEQVVSISCCHNILASKVNESTGVSDLEPFVVPSLPDQIELTRAQLPTNLNTSLKDFKDLHEKINAFEGAYGVMVNSFVDWDQNMLKGYSKTNGDKGCIGPVSLCNKADLGKA